MILERGYHKYDNSQFATIDINKFEFNWTGCATLVAPSGSGKTTLFRLLMGWFPESERSSCHFKPMFDTIKNTRLIGAHSSLLPWLRIKSNASLQLGKNRSQKLPELLRKVGLDSDIQNVFPQSLSFGMYKRVELIFAVIADPILLLLDEFFTSLDDNAKQLTYAFINEVRGEKLTWVIAHEKQISKWIGGTSFTFDVDEDTKTVKGITYL